MEIQGIYFRHTDCETKHLRLQITYSRADQGSFVFLILRVSGMFETKKEINASNVSPIYPKRKGGGAGGGVTVPPLP